MINLTFIHLWFYGQQLFVFIEYSYLQIYLRLDRARQNCQFTGFPVNPYGQLILVLVFFNNLVGKKWSMIMLGIPAMVGWLLIALSEGALPALYAGRSVMIHGKLQYVQEVVTHFI